MPLPFLCSASECYWDPEVFGYPRCSIAGEYSAFSCKPFPKPELNPYPIPIPIPISIPIRNGVPIIFRSLPQRTSFTISPKKTKNRFFNMRLPV